MLLFRLKNTTIQILIGLVLLTGKSWSQETPEAIFTRVKTMASQNDYSTAINLTKQLTSQYPSNLDYKMYLAQLHYWAKDNTSAKNELLAILKEKPNHQEAFDILIKTEFQAGNYETVIQQTNDGKNKFQSNTDFYTFQEALALEKLKRNEEALSTLKSIPKESKIKNDADYIETQILKKKKNTIAIGHLFTDFENATSPLNITHLEYGRKIGQNTFIGRVQYGSSNDNTDLQAEIDGYLKVKAKSYLYLNSGISGDKGIFPEYKLGAEYYQDFNKISSSLGARYLSFNKDNNTLLFTGHLGVYLKNWKIEYRHYLAENNRDWFSSSILNFRRNFETRESYVQLDLQYGSLPYFLLTSESFQRLNAYRVGLNAKIRIEKNYFIQPIIMYEREEFIPNEFRNRYSLQFILSKRF